VARTVLILHSSAGLYGADVQLLAIVRGLDPERWRAICVLPERGELAPLLEAAGARVSERPELAVLRRRLANPAGALGLARAVRRDARDLGSVAREEAVAVVHANTSVVLASGAVARGAGAGHVVHVREIYTGAAGPATRALWPALRRRILRADAVACISDAVAEQFHGASNVSVVRDGLPRSPEPPPRAAARAELGVPADRFAVALVGRVSDWKGQDVLARALAEPALAEIGAVGLVAGDPVPGAERDAAELDTLAEQLGVSDRLLRLGFRPDVDVVLGAADALAVPSKRPEPLGLVALEAAATGLPVVASNAGGVVEAVGDGTTGALVPPDDPAALAAGLRALADDPERARRLGAGGRELVAARFALPRMLDELQGLYDKAAGV
jgi:glycosyltransferase involved in cell wall biosynthesis